MARADGWRLHPTLPREVPAYDFSTGGEYQAPPIPYGHYAKDYHAEAAKAFGHVTGPLRSLHSGLGGLFHGDGCGKGCDHGDGCGSGHGLGLGLGHGHGGCGLGTGGDPCGFCAGRGLFHGGFGGKGCGLGSGAGLGCGLLKGGHKKNFAPCHASTVVPTSQSLPTSQSPAMPSGQSACGDPGCKLGGIHSHLGNLIGKLRCRFCAGKGCGGCGGMGLGDPCSSCGGLGHGGGNLCGGCGGCGLLGHGGKGCGFCGGQGCANCLKSLASKGRGLLGSALGMLHHNKFDWFVGPGGPVPLTPGYVPYIVTTRSPREFFAFPPMNPNVP